MEWWFTASMVVSWSLMLNTWALRGTETRIMEKVDSMDTRLQELEKRSHK